MVCGCGGSIVSDRSAVCGGEQIESSAMLQNSHVATLSLHRSKSGVLSHSHSSSWT